MNDIIENALKIATAASMLALVVWLVVAAMGWFLNIGIKRLRRIRPCRSCKGTGWRVPGAVCSRCDGHGVEPLHVKRRK